MAYFANRMLRVKLITQRYCYITIRWVSFHVRISLLLAINVICYLSSGCLWWQANSISTRMVQLPATAAIEYVAACCRTRTRTRTKTRTKTKTGAITETVLGAYARSPQVQCIYAPSRLSVPSILAWRTKKRETRPPSSAGSRPPLPKFSGYVELDAPDIFHPNIIWVRPLFTELGPKNPIFAHKANEYMSP